MGQSRLIGPANQPAKFVELFYDIIFVFSIVQLVEILHGHFDFATVYGVALIFWLIWWSWTQFTWVLNLADTEADIIELSILVVTAISYFMAISIPDAFGKSGVIFGIAWGISRVIGLILYLVIAGRYSQDAKNVVRAYGLLSTISIVGVVVGGIFGGTIQYVIWTIVVFVDIANTFHTGGEEGWIIHSEHFAERHGLFMIISLGETLLINASSLADLIDDSKILTLGITAVVVTLGYWWNYFAHLKEEIEREFEELEIVPRVKFARDGYSLLHFPIFLAVIFFASALEDVVLHPLDTVSFETKLAFAVGNILFVTGIAVVLFRANRRLLYHRFIIPFLIAIVIFVYPDPDGPIILSMIFIGLVVIAVIEEFFIFEGHDSSSKHSHLTQ